MIGAHTGRDVRWFKRGRQVCRCTRIGLWVRFLYTNARTWIMREVVHFCSAQIIRMSVLLARPSQASVAGSGSFCIGASISGSRPIYPVPVSFTLYVGKTGTMLPSFRLNLQVCTVIGPALRAGSKLAEFTKSIYYPRKTCQSRSSGY